MQQGLGIPGGSNGEESACNTETRVRSVGWEDSPEESMAAHSSILAWRIPWAEVPPPQRSPWGCKEWEKKSRNTEVKAFLYHILGR